MKNFPRKTVGNEEARSGKREDFKKAKTERNGLADVINNAMSTRKIADNVDKKMEGVMPDVKPKRFKK